MEPLIETDLPLQRIDNRLIRFSRPADGIHEVIGMLEVWPKPSGAMISVVKPYDPMSLNETTPRMVEHYADLTQEEFDRYAADW